MSNTCIECCTVRVDDGTDNCESKSMTFGVTNSLRTELLKRLEETFQFVERDECPGVANRNRHAIASRGRRNLDLSTGDVMAKSVVQKVRNQNVDESGLTLN